MKIDIIGSQLIDHADSAFPTLIKLDNGNLICGFCRGNGPEIAGGSHWARSTDNGDTWQYEGVILPRTEERDGRHAVNTLRLSRCADGRAIAYGQRNYITDSTKFGTVKNEAVYCVSDPLVKTWSGPRVLPLPYKCPVEISNPILVLHDGRRLAPFTLLPDQDHLGEKVMVLESSDEGGTWDREYTVLADPERKKGFFEKKIIETAPGHLLAFAWAVELGTYRDYNNHFAISADGGRSWTPPRETGLTGQTLTPLWLGDRKFLLIYNFRRQPQGIRVALADIDGKDCRIEEDDYLWTPGQRTGSTREGIDSFDDFAFGLPSAMRLDDRTFLAVFWCKEDGVFGIRTIKFQLTR